MKRIILFVINVLIMSNSCIGWKGKLENPRHLNGKEEIYLQKSNEQKLINLINRVNKIIHNHGYPSDILVSSWSVNDTIHEIEHNRPIINLDATDFYEYNFANLPLPKINIIYNGLENLKTVCVLNVTSKSKEACNERIVKTDGVMLLTPHIFKNQEQILNILTSDAEVNKHIIVCLRHNINNEYEKYNKIKKIFQDFTIDFQQCEKGPIISHDTLAVMAPESLKNTESKTPFLFYETFGLKLIPEYKDRFPNSAELLSWQSLVITMMEFIKLMNWQRIAILSDDSAFSEIFEEKLISEIDNTKNILYGVKQCSGRHCDFTEAVMELHDIDVKVIIVNVDEANIEKLLETVMDINMGSGRHWIFKGHLEKKTLPKMEHFYNIHIQRGPIYPNYENVLLNIYNGIHKIRDIYEESRNNDTEFRRKIAILEPEDFEIAEVYRHRASSRKKVATIYNNRNPERHENSNYSAWPSGCSVKGDTFYKSCSDMYILYIILILIMFLLLTLIILCFFDSLQKNVNNYVNI